jgi:hypothetical protein
LRALVKGRTAAEAEAALAPYGKAKVSIWPAWATTVTGIDARLSVSVVQEGSTTAPTGSPASSAGSNPATPRRSAATGSAAP